MSDKSAAKKAKRGFTIERTWESTLDDVWDLWTTKEGIESWWGPEAPKTRLEYTNLVDFVPDAAPYTLGTTVELHAGPGGIRMVVKVDAMHDDVWTPRAKMGWESQLEKLGRVLEN